MILAVLPVLVAGRVAVTRTDRLRKDIRENLNLLGSSRPTTRTGRR
jgi:hypothetical protein